MNHYDVLEVSHKASPEVVKAAYKSLMQRYHPDKNPENNDAAARAARITHAYDVLSDAIQRAAYDISISPAPETRVAARARGRTKTRPPTDRSTDSRTKGSRAYLYFWMLVFMTIFFSGWVSLTLLKKHHSGTVPVTGPNAAISAAAKTARSNQNGTGVDGYGQKQSPEARSLTLLLASGIAVNLKDAPASPDGSRSFPSRRAFLLKIPVILVHIGSFDSSEFIRYMGENRNSINEKLEERLAEANPDELLKTSGEQYLQKFLLDVVQDISGTSRFDTAPASGSGTSSRYGVTAILLPESFSLK